MDRGAFVVVAGMLLCSGASALEAQTLRGSPRAMQKQNRIAVEHDYTFIQTSAQLRRFAELGLLVHLPGNADYSLARVSHPYARPAVKLFVERLASQYRAACGEKLVVTSLTRPVREQPRNASNLSVHPAGMAVDLRVSGRAACRSWLERTLMSLERQGVLDAIRENRPPHYHVALFPQPYTRYVARLTGGQARPQVAAATSSPPAAATAAAPAATASVPQTLATANLTPEQPAGGPAGADETVADEAANRADTAERLAVALESDPDALSNYRVNRGDSLWSIARRHGTTVEALQRLNGLRSSRIVAGQVLAVPTVAAGAGP